MRRISGRRQTRPRPLRTISSGIVALVVVLLACAGCGGSTGSSLESQAVMSVAHRFVAALLHDNGSEACSLMSGSAQRQEVELLEHELAETGPEGRKLTCPEAIEKARQRVSSKEVAEAEHVNFSVTSLSGATATIVSNKNTQHATETMLSKTPTGWQVTKFVGAAS
jgi:hypothetical protein